VGGFELVKYEKNKMRLPGFVPKTTRFFFWGVERPFLFLKRKGISIEPGQ